MVGEYIKYPEEIREVAIKAQMRRWKEMKRLEVEIRKPSTPSIGGAGGIVETEIVAADIDYDNECTCGLINWAPNGEGFRGCPFCEHYDGEWDEDDD